MLVDCGVEIVWGRRQCGDVMAWFSGTIWTEGNALNGLAEDKRLAFLRTITTYRQIFSSALKA